MPKKLPGLYCFFSGVAIEWTRSYCICFDQKSIDRVLPFSKYYMVEIIINYKEISQRRCQSLSIYIEEDRYWLGEKLHHTKYLKDSWYTWVQPIDLSQEKCTCLLNLIKNNRSNTYTIFCKHLNKTGKFDIWEKCHLIPSLYHFEYTCQILPKKVAVC